MTSCVQEYKDYRKLNDIINEYCHDGCRLYVSTLPLNFSP